ncbi:MAG: hypothetical protein CL782_00230 [Chloroflexi bacterium]|nr:hypothetical protein [Chloroflexota bacterium]|tara:strand:+ start:28673 stop:29233 length:561 start_codon:yes stop_codon:yes gene_type:complete
MRDKTRDNLYKNFLEIGLDCELAERGIPEDKLNNPWYLRSLGVIKINSDSPIKYVNIIKRDRSKDSPPKWWNHFAIPLDQIISENHYLEVKSIRKKTFPVFGKVKSVIWKSVGNGNGLLEGNKLAAQFTEEDEINMLAFNLGNIKIKSLHGSFSGFSIEVDRKISINLEQWNSLTKMARMCIAKKK